MKSAVKEVHEFNGKYYVLGGVQIKDWEFVPMGSVLLVDNKTYTEVEYVDPNPWEEAQHWKLNKALYVGRELLARKDTVAVRLVALEGGGDDENPATLLDIVEVINESPRCHSTLNSFIHKWVEIGHLFSFWVVTK